MEAEADPRRVTASKSRAGDVWLITLLVLWALGVVGAMSAVWRYKSTPGAVGHVPASWPDRTTFGRDPFRTQLVMFVHPRCACSRASLAELNHIVHDARGLVSVEVAVYDPSNGDREWRANDIWEQARAIPGARVVVDRGGEEALRFGARTSGFVVVYDPGGHLLYQGGLTFARGHEGESPARQRLLAILHGGTPEQRTAPVFGCGLLTPVKRPV